MTILNFNFTKIAVERKGKITKELKIESKMTLVDVKSSKVTTGSKQKAFVIEFAFDVDYQPKVANINLLGNLIYLADEKLSETIEKEWKAKKLLPKEITMVIFNRILDTCNIEALILSKEVSLPAPIKLPKVKVSTENSK